MIERGATVVRGSCECLFQHDCAQLPMPMQQFDAVSVLFVIDSGYYSHITWKFDLLHYTVRLETTDYGDN